MSQTGNTVRGGYQEVETLDDPGGARAIISQRVGHPNVFTVAFFRTFERDGQRERTSFFAVEHFDSLRRMIDTSQKRIDELKNQSKSANRR